VLLTSAGRRVALLRHFRGALARLGLMGPVIAGDVSKLSAALNDADEGVILPRVDSDEYVSVLAELCRIRGVRLVVPLIDTELEVLAERRAEVEATGARLVVSSPATARICADKRLTADFFRRNGWLTPAVLDRARVERGEGVRFPVFVKPARGSGSQGAGVADTPEEARVLARKIREPLFQELAVGREYTLDILVDFEGIVRCVVPRERVETRAGEISKGVTRKIPALIDAGVRVAAALPGAIGCITLQLFYESGKEPCLLEINCRFGGGFPLSAAAGADFPRWIVEWCLGLDPPVALDAWKDGLVMLRFDDAVFADATEVDM
jgi:carbamoyl-phosphate synthase large subunit